MYLEITPHLPICYLCSAPCFSPGSSIQGVLQTMSSLTEPSFPRSCLLGGDESFRFYHFTISWNGPFPLIALPSPAQQCSLPWRTQCNPAWSASHILSSQLPTPRPPICSPHWQKDGSFRSTNVSLCHLQEAFHCFQVLLEWRPKYSHHRSSLSLSFLLPLLPSPGSTHSSLFQFLQGY